MVFGCIDKTLDKQISYFGPIFASDMGLKVNNSKK